MESSTSLKDYTLEQLIQYLDDLGYKKFRAKQLFEWMYQHKVDSFADMSNLPKQLITELEEKALLYTLRINDDHVYQSKSDGTIKFLNLLNDGHGVETAVMKYEYGNTVCISSQAGCNMNCVFCASGVNGKERDLTAGEMLDQIIMANHLLSEDEQINNVVVMGTGEPLENYDNLIKFLTIVNHNQGLNIGQRNITVSTCGLVPEIRSLAEKKLQINLAISLHAANNELRNQLVPVNKKYPLEELLEACHEYFNITNRRISFEYILFSGINDSPDKARELAHLLAGFKTHVNLIPYNPVDEAEFSRPSDEQIKNFSDILQQYQINVTIRKERGLDIDGACGQLRLRQ